MAPPGEADEARCRSLLVELLTPVLSEEADRQSEQLIGEFGSLSSVLAADRDQLERVLLGDPRAARHIDIVRTTLLHTLRHEALRRPVLQDMTALLAYLRLDMAWERSERTRIIFMDVRCRVLRDETMWLGTVDATPLYVREVVRRALELGAAAMVAVHNHPSGDPTPTASDIRRTGELTSAAAIMGISLMDHLIVAETGNFSMRRAGLLHG